MNEWCIFNPNLCVLQPWNFAAFSNISLNIRAKFGISTHPTLQILGKTQTGGISDFRISVQFLIKINWHNSRTSDDIDMEVGPITKLDKRNKRISKKMTIMSCRQIVTSLSLFRFMANLEQSGSRILDAQSVKLTFSLIATFYLKKTENRTNTGLILLL